MKKSIEVVLIFFGLLSILLAICFSFRDHLDIESIITAVGFVAAFNFFIYKLFTGWLFINLNVVVETSRENTNTEMDDIVFNLILSKGSIDSVWIEDIQIRLSEITYLTGYTEIKELDIIKPIGIKKIDPEVVQNSKKVNYWKGKELRYYIISPSEQVTFAAYTRVRKGTVIAAEVLILGTRPFYGIEKRLGKLIQWKSSTVVLPK